LVDERISMLLELVVFSARDRYSLVPEAPELGSFTRVPDNPADTEAEKDENACAGKREREETRTRSNSRRNGCELAFQRGERHV
jgi:hypothetical protein